MKRVFAVLLALAMVFCLCACGDGGNNTANVNTNNEANVAPEPEPEPEPEPPKFYNPLTGEETEEDLTGQRPIGIMMNNIEYAMPMHGNSDADILIEMNAEGNITRMIGLFQQITSKTQKIGSIRSARPYYLDWALAFDAVYISAGGSSTALKEIPKRNVVHVNALGADYGIFYRDQDRKAAGYAYEHTLFATGQGFVDHWSEVRVQTTHRDGYECSLKFTDASEAAGGTNATAITVKMNSKKATLFDYDAASKKYLISEHGDKYIDGNTNEQVSVKNVMVFYTKYWREPGGTAGTLLADMSGGDGVYICEGKMIDIKWSRTDEGGLILTKADGSPLSLMPGHTFICCADSSSGSVDAK